MEITKKTKDRLRKLYLHDGEIKKIICDYDQHMIIIPISFIMKNNDKKFIELILDNVYYFDISMYEPWGEGIYISDIMINDDSLISSRFEGRECIDNDCFEFIIILNSGDKIRIITSKVTYNEKY
ncbi:hypothetical protein ABG79_01269 [Caloramator mitchellensis]|uniref:Uncharacterized protein n=1 Tax=Caloramator mitchellensis TaxID=908809 RepID=A0A0R3JUQ2_CALMK|nr:hypothetical protein [Caloramator mitchellensis]KRQ86778.1 hypothetical protein ABG79_01269 [Caloramator mitchellensis]